MDVETVSSLDTVPPAAWNRLNPEGDPFLRHEFLHALETTGCAGPETGWMPQHLLLGGHEAPVAAMPLYLREDSWGEFVFDWGWAEAYRRAGLAYYPKLSACVPFTPATGRRLLTDPAAGDPGPLQAAVLRAALDLARRRRVSSLHVLFPHPTELGALQAAGLLQRRDCQFHWHNRGYADFDAFLATFSSAKRKKVRRERRRVLEMGVTHRVLSGEQITPELWELLYGLSARTFLRRGRPPYLNLEFFLQVSRTMGEQLVAIVAEAQGAPIAVALCFRSPTVLYGRYWGSLDDFHSLHFETCYYQGIEYCIAQGLERFEPGTQGEHKLSRGFVPETTWSAHWLADPRFRDALDQFLHREAAHVQGYIEEADRHTPYRRDADPSGP